MAKRKKKFNVDELLNSIKPANQLVVYNDKHNSFDWVIGSFMEILEHNYYQAEQCANIIHTKGRCVVREGNMDMLNPLLEAITEKGLTADII